MAKAKEKEKDVKPKAEKKPEETVELAPAIDNGEMSVYANPSRYDICQRAARMFSASNLVPDQFKGNVPNCFIAIQIADRMDLDPFMFMQNSYVVHGRPGIEGKLVIALMNTKGPFSEPLEWELVKDPSGKITSCTCTGTLKGGAKRTAEVTWHMVEKEGWSKKAGSKWLTLPDLMFRYRSATFLARTVCPEVLMGLPTIDELRDIDGDDKHTTFVESKEVKAKQIANESASVTADEVFNEDQSLDDINDPSFLKDD